ncbi:MAG: hypothetical protein Kow0074_09980 [Candidatus Zixiibacteriota bacterium]
MYTVLILLHVIICAALIISVLLQSAKGEGLAGAFGGSSLTGTVFGGRGAATFLSKATTVLAVAFMASCIVLTFVSPGGPTASVLEGSSAVEEAVRKGEVPAPQQPVAPAQGGQQGAPADPASDLFDDAQTTQPEGGQPAGQPAEDAGQQGGGSQQQETPPDDGGQ